MTSSVVFDGSVPVVSRGKQMLRVVSDITGALKPAGDNSEDASTARTDLDLYLVEALAEESFDLRVVTERLMHSADQD
jgi:hypothetical protein